MEYKEFKFLYPPRPEFALPSDRIKFYQEQGWAAQVKKNGTCTIIAKSPDGEFVAMNRHASMHKAWQLTQHIKQALGELLPTGYWTVLCAEIMHSKTPTIKDTIFVHDVLVHMNQHLVGSTFESRQFILERLLPKGTEKYSHYEITPFIWRARLFKDKIQSLFQSLEDTKIDEGVVLKKLDGVLKPCIKPDANSAWQAKVRYPNKNYQF